MASVSICFNTDKMGVEGRVSKTSVQHDIGRSSITSQVFHHNVV